MNTPVKRNAHIGGWSCLILAVAFMFFPRPILSFSSRIFILSPWTFYLSMLLLLAAFILAIAALRQKHFVHGVALLLCTAIVVSLLMLALTAAGLRGPRVSEEDTKGGVALAQIRALNDALINYKRTFKKYPSSLEALVNNPEQAG